MVQHDTFTISRHLDTPPDEVFAAFADTATRQRWFRLPGSGARYEHDFRTGGGETASSTFTALDAAPELLGYRYEGDGSTDLAHLRGGTVLRLNGLEAVLRPADPPPAGPRPIPRATGGGAAAA